MSKLPTKPTSENMSASAQMMLREYASHRWPTMNHKGRMSRLAGVLQWGHRRVKAIYQNDPRARLRADEMAAIEALQQREIEGANRAEFKALADRIAALEAALLAQDEDFHQPQMAALGQALDGRRRSNGADATPIMADQSQWTDISG